DDVLIVIDEDAATRAAIGTDALLRLEEPDPMFVQEVLAAQGPNRTEIDHVAREFVVDWPARENIDLGMMAAVDDVQLRRTANFAREANTARTHDAAIREERDVLADIGLVGRLVLVVDHPAGRPPETIAVILQMTFAGLVAHGAIERVVEQQRLERLMLGV